MQERRNPSALALKLRLIHRNVVLAVIVVALRAQLHLSRANCVSRKRRGITAEDEAHIPVTAKMRPDWSRTCKNQPVVWLVRPICRQNTLPGNPTLWRGVPVASIEKSFGSSGRHWKPWKKLPIPCKFCTYRFIRYPSTCYGKVRINPLMPNTRNPDFFASPVANAAWFVVVRPCYLNRDLLSGPKGN